MDSGSSEQDLVSESLGPSEGEETTSPERSSNQSNVLQSSLVGLVSSQDLSDESSHIGTNSSEVTGTAQVGSQSGCEGVLKTVGQESKVEVLDVGGLGENSGSGQKSGRDAEKRNSLLSINFESLGFRDDKSTDDSSADVAHDALGVEKKLGGCSSLDSASGTNGGVGPGTSDSGRSHLCSFCQKSRKSGTVDSTGIEGENHSHTDSSLLRERHKLRSFLSRGREDGLGIDGSSLASVGRRQAGGHGQVAGEKHRKKLHGCSILVVFEFESQSDEICDVTSSVSRGLGCGDVNRSIISIGRTTIWI